MEDTQIRGAELDGSCGQPWIMGVRQCGSTGNSSIRTKTFHWLWQTEEKLEGSG